MLRSYRYGHLDKVLYLSVAKSAFGDTINCQLSTSNFFTGKPHVDGLGHAFLLRNYRADLGKWPTADPLGYPDGWNQMAYGRNEVISSVDMYALRTVQVGWTSEAGAMSGVMQTLGITCGYYRSNGFTFGFYSTTGGESYVGASASTGLEIVLSNSNSIEELAGVGYQVEVSGNALGGSIAISGSIPIEAATNGIDSLGGSRLSRPAKADTTSVSLPIAIKPFHCRSNSNIMDTGFYSFGLSFSVSTPGIPVEVHNYVTYTVVVSFLE